jgi:hypothetical protein
MNNTFITFVILVQLVEVALSCFTQTASDGTRQKELEVIESELTIKNFISIEAKKNCSKTGVADQVVLCYNTGTCQTKNVFVNLTHYQKISYCKCPIVSWLFVSIFRKVRTNKDQLYTEINKVPIYGKVHKSVIYYSMV